MYMYLIVVIFQYGHDLYEIIVCPTSHLVGSGGIIRCWRKAQSPQGQGKHFLSFSGSRYHFVFHASNPSYNFLRRLFWLSWLLRSRWHN